MSDKLKRWNGTEWVEVTTINKVEVQGGSGGSFGEIGTFELVKPQFEGRYESSFYGNLQATFDVFDYIGGTQ